MMATPSPELIALDADLVARQPESILQLLQFLGLTYDAVFLRGPNGIITYWDKGAEHLYGWSVSEAVGVASDRLLHTHFPALPVPIGDLLARDGAWEGQLIQRHKDGALVVVLSRQVLLRNGEGGPVTILETNRQVVGHAADALARQALGAIVESSQDAILSKTLDAIILSWNGGAERLYGYRADEVIGRSVSLIIPPEIPNELPNIMEKLKRGERIEHYQTERITKYGRRLTVSLAVSPICDDNGIIVGASAVARDVTPAVELSAELARTAEARDRALDEARKALRVRDEFFSTISHDLRNPLAVIHGMVQLAERQMERNPETTGVPQLLAGIAQASGKMGAMIDELLDLSRLESGRPMQLNIQPTDLLALVTGLVVEHRREAPEHTIETQFAAPEIVGLWDTARIDRVLTNLLSNAIKYTPTGGHILVSVAASKNESDGSEWAIVGVEDDGIGIPSIELPWVFERYHRASNVPIHTPGAGIGLAGARQIVEQHGGTLMAESDEGVGSRFIVRLPIRTA
jgi:PAS domain S-box-containing protein